MVVAPLIRQYAAKSGNALTYLVLHFSLFSAISRYTNLPVDLGVTCLERTDKLISKPSCVSNRSLRCLTQLRSQERVVDTMTSSPFT